MLLQTAREENCTSAFRGSLFQQMDEAYDFIDFRNQTHLTFERQEPHKPSECGVLVIVIVI